jgi:hypothetical protein
MKIVSREEVGMLEGIARYTLVSGCVVDICCHGCAFPGPARWPAFRLKSSGRVRGVFGKELEVTETSEKKVKNICHRLPAN